MTRHRGVRTVRLTFGAALIALAAHPGPAGAEPTAADLSVCDAVIDAESTA
ncbi:MAG: hypothetical protein V2I63_11800 [Pseudomonadales bacterium]|jgi:hypothetical protein|nr:hypothetical protein [Pseudomonadales bacterium]